LIELQMARRMITRGLVIAPAVVGGLWFWEGGDYAAAGAIGMAMTLGNLGLSAWIIGGVADRTPQLLVPVALATFALGLLILTGMAFMLESVGIEFKIAGLVLIGSHLGLVLWEAAGAYSKVEPQTSARS
jgi:hypothetical protein